MTRKQTKTLGRHVRRGVTSQSQPIPGREKEMKKNRGGGSVFKLDPWKQLDRFLVLGTAGGTYYVKEQTLTVEAVAGLEVIIKEDPYKVLERILEVSVKGRAPKNGPAIFLLAYLATDERPDLQERARVRSAAYALVSAICRIPTMLWQFQNEVLTLKGGGRGPGLNKALARWYNRMPVERLAYQVVKYQSREGWNHADTLNLARPNPERGLVKPESQVGTPVDVQVELRKQLYNWIINRGRDGVEEAIPDISIIKGFLAARKASTKEMPGLIRDYHLTHEMVPNDHKNSPEVWQALVEHMPMGATVRQLPKLTDVGVLKPLSPGTKLVTQRLRDQEQIQKGRLHPFAVLTAMTVYSNGQSRQLHFTPVQSVVDALDDAFYLAFQNVVPSGKNVGLFVDVSGSMGSPCAGSQVLSCRYAAAALALVTARTEPNHVICAFSNRGWTGGKSWGHWAGRSWGGHGTLNGTIEEVKFSAKSRLDDVQKQLRQIPMGGTDCSLPMIWATENKIPLDAFVVITDNETWAGDIHPTQALAQYRRKMHRPDACLISVAMTATGTSIADPADPKQLDVAGFDTATPDLISKFIRGEF